MNAADTNVLVYVIDARDPRKQQAAKALTASLVDGVLLWQVACEYVAVSRKLSTLGYLPSHAFTDLRRMLAAWPLVVPSAAVLTFAEALLTKYSLSFWDALLVSACREAGVKRLYTEDFSGYGRIEGIEMVNPFTP